MITSELQRTAGFAGLIGATTFLGAMVGFVLQLLIAYFFGASSQTDAYFMALSGSEILSKLLLGGSVTAVFIPVFLQLYNQQNKEQAWRVALNVIHTSASLFLIATTLLALISRPFIHFIAPGFDEPTSELTITLLRILLPAFFLLSLVELLTAILHALKQFVIPSLLRVISPLASIIAVAAAAPFIGVYSLAIGLLLSSAIQVSFLIWGLKRQDLPYSFIFEPFAPHIKQLLALVAPFVISMMATQAAGIVYRILVSHLAVGSLSSLKFAEKITQFLTIMFLTSVTVVIYPLLSEKAAKRDYHGMRQTIASSIVLISLVTVPLMIGVAVFRQPLISLVYERGSFTLEDTQQTSLALLFFIIGLTINGISSILGHATLALKQTHAAAAVTVASQCLAIALFVLLVPLMGHAGLALASSLVPLGITLLYFLFLNRYIPNLTQIFWKATYLKIAILSSILLISLWYLNKFTAGIQVNQTALNVFQIISSALCGSLIFFGGAYLWRIPEMSELVNLAKYRLPYFKNHS